MKLLTKAHVIREVRKVAEKRDELDARLLAISARCPHEWRKYQTLDDHDGWSRNVNVTWTDYFRCDVCNSLRTESRTHFHT